MQDQTLILIVLTVVAIATTVQAFALVSALLAVRRLEGRFAEAERELTALRPRLERLGSVIDSWAERTDVAAERLPRVAADIEGTLDRLRGFAQLGAMILVKPLRPFGVALALWKGLKGGVDAYRRLRSSTPSGAPRPSLRPFEGGGRLEQ
jgi:hypothetical protein